MSEKDERIARSRRIGERLYTMLIAQTSDVPTAIEALVNLVARAIVQTSKPDAVLDAFILSLRANVKTRQETRTRH